LNPFGPEGYHPNVTSCVAWIVLAALAPVQDAPTVTIDRTATIEAHLAEIQRATGGKIKSLLENPEKKIPVKLQAGSFFEALDTVCRAEGNVTYFGSGFARHEGTVEVSARPWIEYPVVYSGPFRIMVCEFTRMTQRSSLGNRGWSRVHMVLFAPPWISVGEESGAHADFIVQEARDAAGNDLIPAQDDREPVQRISVADYASIGTESPSNSSGKAVQLRPFDPDRGLALFRGHIALTVADGEDAAISPKTGETVKTVSGTLKVDRVAEHLKTEQGTVWRLQLTFKPEAGDRPLRALLENRVKEGDGTWRELDLPRDGMTFEAVLGPLPNLPPTLVFRARKGLRSVDVPFEFRNLTIKKG